MQKVLEEKNSNHIYPILYDGTIRVLPSQKLIQITFKNFAQGL